MRSKLPRFGYSGRGGRPSEVVGFGVARVPRGGAIGMIFDVYGQALTEGELPMALSQSAVSELLEALRTGEADYARPL